MRVCHTYWYIATNYQNVSFLFDYPDRDAVGSADKLVNSERSHQNQSPPISHCFEALAL